MKTSGYIVLVCVLLALVHISYSSVSPGLHSRVTDKGFNYAAQVAIDVLATKIKTEKIPDVSGSGHHLKYSLSNIKVTDFSKPQSNVAPRAGSGLTWSATSLGLSIHADFKYKYKKIIPISGHGNIDVSIRDTRFSLSVSMGMDATGRPTIKSTGCSCDIGHLSIKFHGGASWIYNLLIGLFKGDITRQVQNVICSSAQSSVDKDGEASLSKLPMTATIDHKFLLDYRLLSSPIFTSTYMDTLHKGEVYWSTAVSEAPFPAPPTPPLSSSSKMIYFLGSDYLVNSMAYVAHQHGVLRKNLTQKDLPADKRSFLNITCQGFSICLGSLIPKAKELFPNCTAELHMLSNKPPKMTISSKNIGVNFGGNISFFARAANRSDFFMFSVTVELNTTLTASVKNEMVYGSIENMDLAVKLGQSKVGPIDGKLLQQIMNVAIVSYVKPALNKLGAKGFPLPVTGRVKFTNTQLSMAQDALILGTDIIYSSTEKFAVPQNEFRVITGRENFKGHHVL